MARKKSAGQGKLRTREHVLADLAVNRVERQVLLAGYAVNRMACDYGIDLLVFTFTPAGEVEAGGIEFQVKGTEQAHRHAKTQAVSFRILRADLIVWLKEPLPVILVVYDAAADVAYWVHVQGYFRGLPGFNLFLAGKTITVHLPMQQVLTPAAVRAFAQLQHPTTAQ